MQATIARVVAAGGVSISSNVTREASGGVPPRDPTLPAGNAGTLSTRNDDDSGEITLSAGHGLQSSDKVDVYWDGGMRRGMTATVSGNDLTVNLGAGDVLPAQDTPVVATKQVPIDIDFDGDTLVVLAIGSDRRAHVEFFNAASDSLLTKEIAAGGCYTYDAAVDSPNPLAGDVVASAVASCGDSSGDTVLKIGGLIDAT